jgi:multidrug efflux pump
MNLPRFSITHQPIVLSFALMATVIGIFNLSTMSRREDPEITIRDALVVTSWPGAPAERVAELITDPLEAAISEIAEIEWPRRGSFSV